MAALMNVFICLFHLLKFIDFEYPNYLYIVACTFVLFYDNLENSSINLN